jgi:DNA integrity scanning protein DisA with diadenylate cyclase activity
MWQVGEKLGFGPQPSELTSKIVQYLTGEHLLKMRAAGGLLCITHYGVKEVERALENPDRQTQHFAARSAVNIVHVNNMVNSQIQQGSAGLSQIANITQTATITQNQLADLKEIIDALRDVNSEESLTADQKNELDTEIETLALQAKASKPKVERIKESLSSAKNILEGAAIGAVIVTRIGAWLAGLP